MLYFIISISSSSLPDVHMNVLLCLAFDWSTCHLIVSCQVSEECDRVLHESSPNMLTFEATLFPSSSVSFLHVQNMFHVFS